jgi:hypothetical protein
MCFTVFTIFMSLPNADSTLVQTLPSHPIEPKYRYQFVQIVLRVPEIRTMPAR